MGHWWKGAVRRAALRASLIVGLLAVPAAMLPVGTAVADGICTTLIAGQYQGSSLVVSSGEACLNDATITGSVVVRPGASLQMHNSTVGGAVNSNGATDITICSSTLGSLSVLNSTGNVLVGRAGEVEGCRGNIIKGSVTLQGNDANTISCASTQACQPEQGYGGVVLGANTINGSVNFLDNVHKSGGDIGNVIAGNDIGGSLVCLRNAPPPNDAGYPNWVGAATVGQCLNLNPPV